MHLVCLDLEGILVPEFWVEISKAVGVPELSRTTREEANFDKLMKSRLDILEKNNLKLDDLKQAANLIEPVNGALDFVRELRQRTQLAILSDTFEQFTERFMELFSYPLLFANVLQAAPDGSVIGYKLWQQEGKEAAVKIFKSMNLKVFAAGGSFNNISMLRTADSRCLFRAPQMIRNKCPDIPCVDSFGELSAKISRFLRQPG
ncbi:MAG: bifunctional phosphoserine phosphatase/homoserine phosphotransferase ThrH [Spirochaetes bacterium]|nr:bifunctional phosphoserine phosphatase/homoserine phosphotransferase ThrH [Spirochaetota bacterium]